MTQGIARAHIEATVDAALAEDAPEGDVTSAAFVPASAVATADLVAREPGIFAGADVFEVAMTRLDDRVKVTDLAADGTHFLSGDVLATVEGPARAVLQAERVALNFVQRMCGIATATAQYVQAVEGTGVRVLDTRKTTPLLRAFEKHAVACGGGTNHRFSLSDAAMAKDNHLAVLLEELGGDLTKAIVDGASRLPAGISLEVEVDRLELIEPVLAAGVVGTIMLDNFSPDELRQGVALVAGRAVVEASGGITLETIRGVAETGVDVISVGALTHHIDSLDLGLDVRVS
ncbi:MAG TPA: carboxylating nicotinate-nucleotide diphosphorylase [Aeromicrobium sp.]|nr:carboxylating nicotinate-nucleotide diphosphorylase [Aeromicrobium sp.]HKY58166.1 carboxylating nicotinate-nucleotide diphosphorylase [Aeromicrobium sp.]